MISFCQSIQHASPINAHFSPEPSYMPGYEDDIIMAAGTFNYLLPVFPHHFQVEYFMPISIILNISYTS